MEWEWGKGARVCVYILTRILLMWRIWWAPKNASKWQMGFNSVFKGLRTSSNNFSLFLNWLFRKLKFLIPMAISTPSPLAFSVISQFTFMVLATVRFILSAYRILGPVIVCYVIHSPQAFLKDWIKTVNFLNTSYILVRLQFTSKTASHHKVRIWGSGNPHLVIARLDSVSLRMLPFCLQFICHSCIDRLPGVFRFFSREMGLKVLSLVIKPQHRPSFVLGCRHFKFACNKWKKINNDKRH